MRATIFTTLRGLGLGYLAKLRRGWWLRDQADLCASGLFTGHLARLQRISSHLTIHSSHAQMRHSGLGDATTARPAACRCQCNTADCYHGFRQNQPCASKWVADSVAGYRRPAALYQYSSGTCCHKPKKSTSIDHRGAAPNTPTPCVSICCVTSAHLVEARGATFLPIAYLACWVSLQ